MSEYALHSNSKKFAPVADALRAKFEAEWRAQGQKRTQALQHFFTFMFAEKGDKLVAAATPPSSKDPKKDASLAASLSTARA